MTSKNKQQFDKPSNLLLIFNKYIKIISLLVIFVTLIFGYLIVLQPKIDVIKSTKQNEIPEIQKKEDAIKQLLSKLNNLEQEYNTIKSKRSNDLEKLYKIVPNNADIANIFLIADRLANEHGFQLLSIDIAEPNNKSIIEKNKEKIKKGEKIKEEVLQSLIIHMVVAQVDNNDGYEGFKLYLAGLENSLRLMDIQTVNFEGFSDNEESYSTFNFSIITYFNNQDNG